MSSTLSTMSRLLALLLLVLGNAAAFAPTLASRSMVAARAPAVSVRRRRASARAHFSRPLLRCRPPPGSAPASAPRRAAGRPTAPHTLPLRPRGALCAKILSPGHAPAPRPRRPRSPPPLQMSRICDITGKRANNANRVTFSNHHNQRWQQVNLQTKRFFSPELNREVRLKVATSTLRTIRKLGLDETAKKYNVDLSKF